MPEYRTLIHVDEAMELLRQSKDDLVMDQLLNYANFVVLGRFKSDSAEELPVADFDLSFYLKAIERFCQEQVFLKAVLAHGELSAFGDKLYQMNQLAGLAELAAFKGFEDKEFYTRIRQMRLSPKEGFRFSFQPRSSFVRSHKAMSLLLQIEDSTTKFLMLYGTYIILLHGFYSNQPPAGAFDFYFCMRAMESFCGNHQFLTQVLDGEDLRWFSVA